MPSGFPLVLMNSERELLTVRTELRTLGRGALAGSERRWMGSSCSALSWKAGDSMMRWRAGGVCDLFFGVTGGSELYQKHCLQREQPV